MIREEHTVQVEGLALHGLGAGIEHKQRVDFRFVVAGLDTHAYALALRKTEQVDDHFESGAHHSERQCAIGMLKVVNPAKVDAHLELVDLK
jgi:hypothetical protein